MADNNSDDQTRWDDRYRSTSGLNNVNELLIESSDLIATTGRSLDIAGGSGADSLFLATHGLDATLLDISPVALEMARDEAAKQGVSIHTIDADTEVDALPRGPWDVIHIAHYLHRPTITAAAAALAPGGLLIVSIATTTNLERRSRPPAAFLLDPGELPHLVGESVVPDGEADGQSGSTAASAANNVSIVRFDEDWRSNGVHEAWLVARAAA